MPTPAIYTYLLTLNCTPAPGSNVRKHPGDALLRYFYITLYIGKYVNYIGHTLCHENFVSLQIIVGLTTNINGADTQ